ncbi:MAG: LPS-assembly protein LptD [Candidatus Firestonebacteria bacterium]|nr:LPS-assembly protein LptD [Candidatus Firestonebacteria bacterium]
MKKIKIYIFLVLLNIFLYSSKSLTEETNPITITGDYLEYVSSQNTVFGKGNVHIIQSLKKLSADEVEYNLDSSKIIATGNVIFEEKGTVFKGNKIIYNVKDGTSIAEESIIYSTPWHFKTAKVYKTDKKTFKTETPIIMTTCDNEDPHYNFEANKMIIYLNDKIIAHNVFFHVGQVPVLYSPVYVYLLKYTPFYFLPGYNSKYGWWAKTALHFTTPPYTYGSFLFDLWERRGYGKGIKYNYYVDENKRGSFYFYSNDERAIYFDTSKGRYYNPYGVDPLNRWKSQIYISHEIIPKLTVKVSYKRLSDPDFELDYENVPVRYLNEDVNFSLIKSEDTYTISALRQDVNTWDDSLKEYVENTKAIPEIKLDFIKKPIGEILNQSIYYKPDILYSYRFQKHYKNDSTGIEATDYFYRNAYVSQSLMTSFNLLPRTSLSPTVRYIQNWYSNHDPVNLKDRNYGSYDTQLRLTLDITSYLRNELIHDYTRQLDELTGTGYTIYNGIVKNEIKDIISLETSEEELKLSIETSYELRKREREEIPEYRTKFRDIASFLQFEPNNNLKIGNESRWDIYADENDKYEAKYQGIHKEKFKLNDTYIELKYKLTENSKIGFNSRYYHIYIDETEPSLPGLPLLRSTNSYASITGDLQFEFSKKWMIVFRDYFRNNDIYKRFYGKDFKREQQSIEFIRDLHCWEVHFSIKNIYEDTMVQEFWINFRLKAFPGQKIEIKEPRSTYSTFYNFK